MNALEGAAPRTRGPFSHLHIDGRRTVATFIRQWRSSVERYFCVLLTLSVDGSVCFVAFCFGAKCKIKQNMQCGT